MERYDLGIDLGGTFLKYGLVDENYNVVENWKIRNIDFASKDELYDYVCANIKNLDEIRHIGVSMPSVVDADSNVKTAGMVKHLLGTNVSLEIGGRTGKKTAAIHDGKAAGLCELKLGNLVGTKSGAVVVLGTGTGGCITIGSEVWQGNDGLAGDILHLPVFKNNSKYERIGAYCGVNGLIGEYNKLVADEAKVEYGHDVCIKYLAGDENAKLAFGEWLMNLTSQLLIITTVYNSEVICIGGGISEETWIIDLIRTKYNWRCEDFYMPNIVTTRIEKCKYNNDSNILGAVLNVNQH